MALAASAAEIVGPSEFEAMTEGRTLTFDRAGRYFGVEQYLANRQVIWRFADGTCAVGHWFGEGTDICFVYDTDPAPQCWVFERREGDFYARIRGLAAGDPSELRLSGEIDVDLDCPAPNLGV